MATCIGCPQITKKYKCSKCSAPYCSLNCYKTHIGSPTCEELEQQVIKTQAKSSDPGGDKTEPTVHDPFTTKDTVPLTKLQDLANCQPLHQLLHNPHLRALLLQVDTARNANLAITAAMQEPLFIEFAHACMDVLEPMTEAERAEMKLLN